MAGYDVGEVRVAYVGEDQREGTEIGDEYEIAPREARKRFQQFLRNETRALGSDEPYSAQLMRQQGTHRIIDVDLQDIKNFDAFLGQQLEEKPSVYLPLLEEATVALLQNLHGVNEDGSKADFSVQVMLSSSQQFGPATIRALSSDNVSQLIMIPGIVTSASKPKHVATAVSVMCKECRLETTFPGPAGLGPVSLPRSCTLSRGPDGSGGACSGQDPWIVLPGKSRFVDQQTLKLQERPEDVPTGELPRSLNVVCERTISGTVAPGTRVTIVGIYAIHTSKDTQKDNRNVIAIKTPYIRVVGLRQEEDTSRQAPQFTMAESERFRAFARQPNVQDRIFDMIAPQIFGSDQIKKAIACLLFGGSRKRLPDGTYRRGDINVLLLGDPSTAKSQFLKYASRTAPISVYTSGKGSSAAGLTASVIKDPSTREFYLEGGAMVLADNGVVCIDEFDKMREEDRVAIHEAMEQQTISIAKAGITTMLKARTSVLAAANPPSGRYDDLAALEDNIELQTTILSRFDLIFIVKDQRTRERDAQIATHVLNIHRQGGRAPVNPLLGTPETAADSDEHFLKRYLQFARSHCFPRLSPEAASHLQNEYVDIRKQVREQKEGGDGDVSPIPVTVRQLEALVRISESLARMELATLVTDRHVQLAIQLFHASTLDAVRSGVAQATNLSDEQKAELHSAEEQILRRIPIGGYVPERAVVEQLGRLGMDQMLVRRACVYLVQREVLEYKKERRILHRRL